MSLDYIRRIYNVPAYRGGRVRYTGDGEQYGTICSASGGHINIRLDGRKFSQPFHPTWKLEYLEEDRSAHPGGCTCVEVYGEDPRCIHHGRETPWAEENLL